MSEQCCVCYESNDELVPLKELYGCKCQDLIHQKCYNLVINKDKCIVCSVWNTKKPIIDRLYELMPSKYLVFVIVSLIIVIAVRKILLPLVNSIDFVKQAPKEVSKFINDVVELSWMMLLVFMPRLYTYWCYREGEWVLVVTRINQD